MPPPTARALRLGATLPLLLATAACASGGISNDPFVLSPGWSPPPGQSCNQSPQPRRLPSVAQIVDSVALAGDLRAVAGRGHAVIRVAYDSLGAARTPEMVDSDLPAGARDAYKAAVGRHVRRESPFPARPAAGSFWDVLLRIDAGAVPRFQVGRTVDCLPVLTNRQALTSYITRTYGDLVRQNPNLPPVLVVPVTMVVDSTGVVAVAYPSQTSGYRAVDELAQRAGVQARFHPGRINRSAVRMLVTLPLTFATASSR